LRTYSCGVHREHHQRNEEEEKERKMTFVANIKKVEEECTKLCEESTQIWIDLVEDPKMKDVEEKLMEAQESSQKYFERINTLPRDCGN